MPITPPIQFTVTHRTDRTERRRYHYRVRVWPDAASYAKARGEDPCDPSLAFWLASPESRHCLGTINLQMGAALRLDAVVHEATHALCEWCRRARCRREESRCYGTDWLVSRIVLGLLKRGLPLFLLGPRATVNACLKPLQSCKLRNGPTGFVE